ncbi:hypothetical protein [Micromonospora sp. NPDC093277]
MAERVPAWRAVMGTVEAVHGEATRVCRIDSAPLCRTYLRC